MKKFFALLIALIPLCAMAQHKMSADEYIATYSDVAIAEMKKSGIPASITLSQGIFESGYGGSRLATVGNNHFGIKCGGSWKGASISHDDDAQGECFRKYDSALESYKDHTKFLQTGARYASLFKLEPTDYKAWAKGLKAAGYATNPRYAEMIIELIERYDLQRFDSPVADEKLYASESTAAIVVNREYREYNSVKYTVVKEGDTWEELSSECKVKLSRLLKYNDLPAEIPLEEGMRLYVKSKKTKNKTAELYTAQPGDSRHSLSQRYGIKQSSLQRLNPVLKKREVQTGDLIRFY
ncbi:MAG: glucosaminidase domain-containing protein [Rikenellaceae bacterium]